MSKTISELLGDANVIKAELTQGKNTANRVGTMLIDIIEYMKNFPKTAAYDVMKMIDTGKEVTVINNKFDSVELSIDEAVARIKALEEREADDIADTIRNIINGEGFIDGWYAGWVNNLEAYLISIGVKEADGSYAWSTIETKYDEISSKVNRLNYLPNEGEYEFFNGIIDTRINDNSVINELKARYALTDKEYNLILWLETGLRQYADPTMAINELFATKMDLQEQVSATAELTQRVEEINGTLTATNALVSRVEHTVNGITDEISAGVITEANLDGKASVILFAEGSQTKTQLAVTVEGIVASGNYLKLANGQLVLTRDQRYKSAFEITDSDSHSSLNLSSAKIKIDDLYETSSGYMELDSYGIKFMHPTTGKVTSFYNGHITGDDSLGISVGAGSSGISLDTSQIILNSQEVEVSGYLTVRRDLSVEGAFSAGSFTPHIITTNNLTVNAITGNGISVNTSSGTISINSNGLTVGGMTISSSGLTMGNLPISGASIISANGAISTQGSISAYSNISTSAGDISAGRNISAGESVISTGAFKCGSSEGKSGSFMAYTTEDGPIMVRINGGIITGYTTTQFGANGTFTAKVGGVDKTITVHNGYIISIA